MIFAHMVPKKGITHEFGADAMIEDLEKLGYKEMILRCDGEPALKAVQEEVKARRNYQTIMENSPVGDSRANGAAERAVQAVEEQVRVVRHGLETRLGMKISGKHPFVCRLIEHAGDLLSKYQVGEDGKTGYQRLKGKKYRGDEVEFGEKVHYSLKRGARQEKLESRLAEGFYLGKVWRTGEAIIGTKSGVHKSGMIRRVGGHRRWDAEGLGSVRGQPWKWDPDKDDPPKDLKIRWLTEEESKVTEEMQEGKVYRLRLSRVQGAACRIPCARSLRTLPGPYGEGN